MLKNIKGGDLKNLFNKIQKLHFSKFYANACTHLYNTWAYDCQDEVEPDVCEDAPEGSNEEDSKMFNLSHLSLRYHQHTDANYHKHVKCSAAHYSARTQFSCLKTMSTHLNTGQKQ